MEKKNIMIEESLYEFAKRGRPRKNVRKTVNRARGIDAPDTWTSEDDDSFDPDELEVDTSDMETAEEIEVEEDVIDDELLKALSNEVKVSEPARRILKFRLKGDLDNILFGVPMAKLGNNAFIFKLDDGKLKKLFLKDIIVESQKPSNRAKMVSENFDE